MLHYKTIKLYQNPTNISDNLSMRYINSILLTIIIMHNVPCLLPVTFRRNQPFEIPSFLIKWVTTTWWQKIKQYPWWCSSQIPGIGETLDIKESRVTITSENKVSEANGQVYNKQAGYIGSYNYTRFGGLSINVNDSTFTVLQVTGEVLKYIDAVENQVSVVMN